MLQEIISSPPGLQHIHPHTGSNAKSVLARHYHCLEKITLTKRFHTPVDTNALEAILSKASPVVVLAYEDETGFPAVCEIYRVDATRAEIGLSVRVSHQGRGIGHMLLDRGLHEAREIGFSTMIAHTRPGDRIMPHLLAIAGARLKWHPDGFCASINLTEDALPEAA